MTTSRPVPLTIAEEPGPERHRLILSGSLDLATAPLLADRVHRLVIAGECNIEIDMGGVMFMDSSGIASLIGVHKRLTGDNQSLVLTQVTPHLAKLFEITGLERYFEFG